MSMLLTGLSGCEAHIGVLPPAAAWAVGAVSAPVAEPDVDRWVRDALTDALAARRGLDPGGVALEVTVTQASWTPSRRAGGTLLYDATLTLAVRAGAETLTRSATRSVVAPGDAAEARTLREATLRALARQLAEQLAGALTGAPSPE